MMVITQHVTGWGDTLLHPHKEAPCEGFDHFFLSYHSVVV